jgi:nitrate/nitrite transporter NarK
MRVALLMLCHDKEVDEPGDWQALGLVLDAYGPRVCSALSILLVTVGFILFASSSPSFPAFLPAIVLIAFGGPGVQSSIIHLSNLYPGAKATVTSVITG